MSAERYELRADHTDWLDVRDPQGYRNTINQPAAIALIRQQARDLEQLRADLAAAVARADLAERDRDILGVRVQDLKDSIADMQHLMDDGASLNVKLINERDRLRSMYVESTERLCGERDTLRARLAAIEAAPTVQSVFVSPFRQVELIERPAKDQP